MRLLLLSFCGDLPAFRQSFSDIMKVASCGIHGFHETIGLDVDEIRVFWTLESAEYAEQTAYRVVISTSERNVVADPSPNIEVTWDSGKVSTTDEQRNILCKPNHGFRSTCNYYWRVTVWDNNDVATHSGIQTFFTAYPRSQLLPPYSMNQKYMPHSSLIFRTWFEDIENKWKAVWIGDGGDKPLYLRKGFDLARKPSKAIALASGLGHFDLHVNGQPASDHVIDPGCKFSHLSACRVILKSCRVELPPHSPVRGVRLDSAYDSWRERPCSASRQWLLCWQRHRRRQILLANVRRQHLCSLWQRAVLLC